MENLNAEQVKKALECCTLGDCTPCPYHQFYVGCRDRMAEDALALINSQEQRIGELEQCWEHEHASAMEIFGQWSEKCERLTEENERLKAQKYYIHSDGRIEMIPTVESVRADTVRKMQERIKQYIDVGHYRSPTEICFSELDVANIIDRIAKEMLEGKTDGDK